jgi:hypothetical protein
MCAALRCSAAFLALCAKKPWIKNLSALLKYRRGEVTLHENLGGLNMRTALAIPFVMFVSVVGAAIVGYLSIFHDIPGAYGILAVIVIITVVLTALQRHFPDKR